MAPHPRRVAAVALAGDSESAVHVQQQRLFVREHSDSRGRPRPDLWRKGLSAFEKTPVATRWMLGPTRPSGSAASSTPQWTEIGPQPIREASHATVFQGTGPASGEIVDIAIDPRGCCADRTMYVATNDGGIWKTSDGGQTWTPKTDQQPSLSMGAVALDPSDASTVYAGTGNIFDGGRRFEDGGFTKGIGLYKSTDGGDHWTAPLDPGGIFANHAITKIAFADSGDVLLVATSDGLYRSTDGGAHFGSNDPVDDNGSPVLTGYITDLKLSTASQSTVFAAVYGEGVYESTDSGAHFPAVPNVFQPAPDAGSIGFLVFAQAAAPDENTMYVSAATAYTGVAVAFDGLYKTTDGGGHWEKLDTGTIGTNCQCGYDQTVAVDPQDADRVYLGFQQLYTSTDGGATFHQVGDHQIHFDQHVLVFSPPSHQGPTPTRLWVGNDGGITTTNDGGASWSAPDDGLATNLFYDIGIGQGTPYRNLYTYGGTQDTAIPVHEPGDARLDWHNAGTGDGGRVVVDADNPQHAYGSEDGIFEVTTDGGASWSEMLASATGLPGGCYEGHPEIACGNPLAVDPNNGDNVWVEYRVRSGDQTVSKLFLSKDGGHTFAEAADFGFPITALAVAKTDSNTVWVGNADSTLSHSSDALLGSGSHWADLAIPDSPEHVPVGGIAIDPGNNFDVVVTFEGFTGRPDTKRSAHVFRTTDAGDNWNDISGTDGASHISTNVPDLPVHAVVIDPLTNPHTIVIGTDDGVLASSDGGATWKQPGDGLPHVDVTSLALDSSENPALLRAGTYGRSVFELTMPDLQKGDLLVGAYTTTDQVGNYLEPGIFRIRGGHVDPYCAGVYGQDGGGDQFVYQPQQVLVDSKGRVVFDAQMPNGNYGFFRCDHIRGQPERLFLLAHGSTTNSGFPHAVGGVHDVSGFHLERIREVTTTGDVATADRYVALAQLEGGDTAEFVYAADAGTLEKQPFEKFRPDVEYSTPGPDMVQEGAIRWSTGSWEIRRTDTPFEIVGKNFDIPITTNDKQLNGYFGDGDARNTIVVNQDAPRTGSDCPKTTGYDTTQPTDALPLGNATPLVYDDWTGLGLSFWIGEYNWYLVDHVSQALLDADPLNDRGAYFLRAFDCKLEPQLMVSRAQPPDAALWGPTELASSPFGLVATERNDGAVVLLQPGEKKVATLVDQLLLPLGIASYPANNELAEGESLTVTAHSPVNTLVTAPDGKKVGIQPDGTIVNDFGVDGFVSAPGDPRVVAIINPKPGAYSVTTAGTANGPYTVDIGSADLAKPTGHGLSVTGTASPGSSATYKLALGGDGSVSLPVPDASTGDATGVTSTAATLTGAVNANGQATTYHFEYGLTTAYGSSTPAASAGAGTTTTPVTATVSPLSPGTTYHYRVVATNATGTADGADATFTTSASPKAPPGCVVPNVKRRRLADAERRLEHANCAVGHVRRVWSNRVRRGLVISQSSRAGKHLPHGARIGLVVSRGRRHRGRRA